MLNCWISVGTAGRPRRRLDFQRQNNRKPAWCHRTTVSGRTMPSTSRAFGNRWQTPTQNEPVDSQQWHPIWLAPTQHDDLLFEHEDFRKGQPAARGASHMSHLGLQRWEGMKPELRAFLIGLAIVGCGNVSSGPSRTWIKVKYPNAPVATRAIDGTF